MRRSTGAVVRQQGRFEYEAAHMFDTQTSLDFCLCVDCLPAMPRYCSAEGVQCLLWTTISIYGVVGKEEEEADWEEEEAALDF